MIDSAIQTILGETWLQGRLQYNYLSPDKVVAETVAYHLNGQMRFSYPVHNNKIHGVGRCWHVNGVLQCEETYVNNSLHGLKREWHANGQIKREVNFKKGIIDGEHKAWHENGVQQLQCLYKEGRQEGEYLEWYDNGQIFSQLNFVGGRRHGIFKHWLPDGKLKKEEIYIRGVHIPTSIYRRIKNKLLTAKDILGMQNAAIRRICLEEVGYSRFLAQVKHTLIEKDGEYELVRIDWHEREEPICLVKVKCPSTGAFYTLRVPPSVLTVKEAVAWTFGLKPNEYCPEKET